MDFLWVALVVVCFWKLPRVVAIPLGAVLGFGGSSCVAWGVSFIMWFVRLAAAFPTLFVTILWLWSIAQTSVVQGIAKTVGLDLNKDGKVDLYDLLTYIMSKVGTRISGR
jgi:hypothetical protein